MAIHPSAHIHPSAVVLGDVTIGPDAHILPTAVLRGDSDRIVVGARTNVQDGAVLHADAGVPCIVGDDVTIGHRAIVHGAIVAPACLIGMGAIVMNGCRIGTGAIVAAGALCPEGMEIPEGMLAVGVPARVVRATTEAERERIRSSAAWYAERGRAYARGEFPPTPREIADS
ncbi:MAG: gamma carbonic anhydrase family protein [Gemmatimonadaceae bacterium]|jgi:carbonic anhydrase/acetyltransferase-like protein (isoleucine patch superfamily)|nr:gamma carbonic anhydrase family protein [Gemmatimonadaceae bacterium]